MIKIIAVVFVSERTTPQLTSLRVIRSLFLFSSFSSSLSPPTLPSVSPHSISTPSIPSHVSKNFPSSWSCSPTMAALLSVELSSTWRLDTTAAFLRSSPEAQVSHGITLPRRRGVCSNLASWDAQTQSFFFLMMNGGGSDGGGGTAAAELCHAHHYSLPVNVHSR